MGIQGREPAQDPQDLERLLVDRQHAGDVEGMVALFEPDAVVDTREGDNPGGRLIRGHAEIRAFFVALCATGRKFHRGEQAPAVINGALALTGTLRSDGEMTAEVARRQSDGTWLWTIDKYQHG